MTRRNLSIAAAVIIILALISSKYIRNKVLPTGTMSNTSPTPTNQLTNNQPTTIGRPQVEIVTSKGKIIVELRPDVAPKTVTNFLAKWNSGYCNNLTFHRVEDWVIQGCDPLGNGTGGADSLPTETSSESFTIGALGVARKAFPKDISNDSQFFIVKKDSIFLNGDYTYFGRVVSGLDIVNQISPGDKIISTAILSK